MIKYKWKIKRDNNSNDVIEKKKVYQKIFRFKR